MPDIFLAAKSCGVEFGQLIELHDEITFGFVRRHSMLFLKNGRLISESGNFHFVCHCEVHVREGVKFILRGDCIVG